MHNSHPQDLDSHHTDSSNERNIDPPQTFNNFYLNKPIIGLTGGIGSGKTAVSNWFNKQGIDVVDADVVSHQIMQKGSPTLQAVADALGDWVLDESGNMDRNTVRHHVFEDNKALLTLESITHPAIRQEIKNQLAEATSDYVILSAPLLLESKEAGLASLCDRILVVDTTEDKQLERASARDTQSQEKIKSIMANQLPRFLRRQQADDIIINNGTLEELYEQLIPIHEQYLTLEKKLAL